MRARVQCTQCLEWFQPGARGPIPKRCGTTCRVRLHRDKLNDAAIPVSSPAPAIETRSDGLEGETGSLERETGSRETRSIDDETRSIDVAALFVRSDGPYADMPRVDLWPQKRDATRYAGPWPIVAHPPCAPWGRYWHSSTQRPDLAVFAAWAVRRWGGVLEHPAGSRLWLAMRMPKPGEPADRWGGSSLAVSQCRFGHAAPKPTWLYIVGATDRPPLPPSVPDPGGRIERMNSRRQRELTPPALACWLVELAKRVSPSRIRRPGPMCAKSRLSQPSLDSHHA